MRSSMFGEVSGVSLPLPFSVELDAYGASLTCHVPRTYHAGSGVVRADKAGEAFTRQGAPPPAPHAPRRAHAHLPCPSRAPPRAILCPIASQLTACVCPESCRSRRELSNEVLYVLLGACFLLRNAFKKPKFSSGAPPGPRDETPSPDAPPRRQGAPVPAPRKTPKTGETLLA